MLPGSRIGGPVARGQRKRKLSAKMVEDEDQLRYERCAGIDVAKASGVVAMVSMESMESMESTSGSFPRTDDLGNRPF
jgi:hypothetical protein